jgi:hypothetical protein
MRRKEPERIEYDKEPVDGMKDEGGVINGLAEGERAIIETPCRRKTKFWRRYNGLECFIVSRHKRSAIVEVLKYKELIVCQVENLRPIGSGRSR